jgi:3-oxoacyl-(acyl-carrier-protein) synthase
MGRGLWTPGFADAFAWLEGHEDPTVEVPACSFVGGRLLRATSVLTRGLCEGAWQAAQEAGFDPAEAPTVFGSMHGEIQTAVDMLDMLRDGEQGIMSPARFKNSVHNTAAGIYSIATRNRAYTTAIAAGTATFAMCLLEALALLGTDEERVVVSVGEELLPPLLVRYGDFRR